VGLEVRCSLLVELAQRLAHPGSAIRPGGEAPRQLVAPGLAESLVLGSIDSAEGPWSDLDQFFVDAISCLWEQIITWSGTTRPYAAGDLLSGVRTRLRTLQATERRHRSRRVDTPDVLDLIPASIGRTGEELLAAELIEATGHRLTPADATVLYSTAVLGMSVTEVADHTGESVVRLRRRRRNVIAGLVA
jgi:hypothetical protein